jgi:hypothetical protein
MWVEPKDDPRLESVADKLATLTRQIDNADWDGKPVTNLQRQGILWEPKF